MEAYNILYTHANLAEEELKALETILVSHFGKFCYAFVVLHKEVGSLLEKDRPETPSVKISGPLFNGTLHFVQITFNRPNGTFSVSEPDVQTAIDYAKHAVIPISKYALQYGQNIVSVSSNMLKLTLVVVVFTYIDPRVRNANLTSEHFLNGKDRICGTREYKKA